MNSDLLREPWEMLDRDHLAEVARKGPEPIFATISGAHLYGFASPDSDVGLRGAFMLPASEMLGLHAPDETITIEDKTTIDLDWVAHDVRKFARLAASRPSRTGLQVTLVAAGDAPTCGGLANLGLFEGVGTERVQPPRRG